MDLTLKVWRQKNGSAKGQVETYAAKGIPETASFLEMLDIVNEDMVANGQEPIAFDHDCREGICGMCSLVINGVAHGPNRHVTTCQLHMRSFNDGDTIWIEPWRARAFPVIRDLVVDRTAFDRVIAAGGYISARAGSAPEANTLPVAKHHADRSFDAAACIGCGACVASCKNSSAMLFVAAKAAHLGELPHGVPESDRRVVAMVDTMEEEGFGNCSNQLECEAVCPANISADVISQLNRYYAKAMAHSI